MNFIFADEEEDDEELDLSDLFDTMEEDKPEPVEIAGLSFTFEEEVPAARSITDADVQQKARVGRQTRTRKVENRDYAGKREAGWSYYCSHKAHLPTLCERAQNADQITCTCPCHKERGFVLSEPEPVSGDFDEEFILLFD